MDTLHEVVFRGGPWDGRRGLAVRPYEWLEVSGGRYIANESSVSDTIHMDWEDHIQRPGWTSEPQV